ncbi:hypothetical protein [uncultured Limnobacter sp.]|uniref:hypothetical protein n=1 Tax=uncultured Limnobacter sp. TaxID=199681 RepID=UPI0030FA01C2
MNENDKQAEPVAWESALEFAAQTIELYDDATMKNDYMLDASECAAIIRALKPMHPAPAASQEPDFKPAYMDWHNKTEWVQEKKDWPFNALGMHRADVMKKYIEHLEMLLKPGTTTVSIHFIDREQPEVIADFRGVALHENKQAKPVHADESMWCRYIASMICEYLGERLGSDKEKAIAGIIERRLWNFPRKAQPVQAVVAQGEPVHFRAVLCSEQHDKALGVVPKVAGFVDKKAAEQFILEQRDFKGWKYSLESLYTEAPAVAVNEQLYTALEGLLAITRDSQGVVGYHLNGVVAYWDKFEEVSAAEAAIAAAEKQIKEQS